MRQCLERRGDAGADCGPVGSFILAHVTQDDERIEDARIILDDRGSDASPRSGGVAALAIGGLAAAVGRSR
jgi:hypothetical protein